jgi:hypothetical protein
MIRSRSIALSAVVSALGLGLLSAAPAHASLTFDFSFSGTGSQTGTVTGIITGLPTSGTGPATDVQILTVPSTITNNYGSLPIDIFAAGWTVGANSFTVTNGQITSGSFGANTSDYNGNFGINDGFEDINVLTLDGNSTAIRDYGGIGSTGVTFTAAAVPEPTSLSLLGVGAAALLGRRRRVA